VQRYLAGALEVGRVGLDELMGVDILHRPRRRRRHPAERRRTREGQVVSAALGLGFGGAASEAEPGIHIGRGSASGGSDGCDGVSGGFRVWA